jgi:O-antigen ligase
VIGGALAVSLSRTVYVGIGVAFAVLLLGWTSRQRRIAVVGATVAILAAITAYPRLVQSVTALFTSPAEDPSITSRTDSYAFALEFFTHAPVFGRGLGTFLPKYRIFDNQYLGILVSLGMLGVLAFIAMLVVAAAALLRMRRASTDPAMRDLALSMVASLAVGAVAFGVFDAFSFPMTAGTLFLCLGLSGSIARIGSLVDTTPMAGDVSDARVTLR